MNRWTELLQANDYLGIKKHIKEGGDVNDHNDAEESVLAMAIKYKCDKEIIDLLIEKGADTDDFDDEGVSIFDYAITYNNVELAKALIESGRDVNLTRRRSGFTPLMAAVCYGRGEILELLLQNGADISAVDSKGLSAADFARKMHKKKILERLTS